MKIVSLLAPALLGCVLAPAASAQVAEFDLVRAVPADYFMVSAERYNPERDFIDAHWARVWDAFEASGIMEDMLDLVPAGMDPATLDLVEGYVERSGALCRQVDWDSFGRQTAFGMRMNAASYGGEGVQIGNEDYLLLMKVDPERSGELFGQLTGWANGQLGLVSGLVGMPLELEPFEQHGVQGMVLDARSLAPGAPNLALTFLNHGPVIGVTFGSDVHQGVIELLAGVEGARSLADSPRFQAAFAALPAPEDGLEYVDMPNLRAQMGDIFAMIQGLIESEMGAGYESEDGEAGMVDSEAMVVSIVDQAMDLALEGMGLMDYTATVHHTEGYSVHETSIASLADGAKDNRFYPLLATSRPVHAFVGHLPATTTGYSVSGGTDMEALYDFALELVGDFGPMGQMALAYWDDMQEQSGFDMRRDVMSWIDGETLSIDFLLDGQPAWVTRMVVKDEAQATEKLAFVLNMIPGLLEMAAEENPMFQMMGLTVRPTRDPRFEGFTEVGVTMVGQSMLCGVRDGAMVFASSGDAIEHCQAVAAGELDNITANETLVAGALLPSVDQPPVTTASYKDNSAMAGEIADALQAMSMMGGMVTMGIEEPEVREVVSEAMRMVGKLGPVVREMDFFRSSSSLASFDGSLWHTHTVTHYAPPKPAKPAR